jgi:putative transposase
MARLRTGVPLPRSGNGSWNALASLRGCQSPASTSMIVHLIRNSLSPASWKDRKLVATALKPIYQAATADAAASALDAFEQGDWGRKFPTVVAMWRRQWEQVIPFFAYPPEVRKIIYTINAIESMHMQLRKIVKNRGHFPSDEAASKLLYLALRNIEKDWKMPTVAWKQAINQFAILFGERFTNACAEIC